MRKYELLYMVKPDLLDEDYETVVNRYAKMLEDHGAIDMNIDKWGKRKLAYVIDKTYHEGYYVLVTFNADNDTVKELDRLMKIDERIIRHMVTRVGE